MITAKDEESKKQITIPEQKDFLTPPEKKLLQRPLNLPTGYLSPSQIEAYLSCPTKYKIRYVDKKKTAKVLALEEGSTGHSAIECNNLHKIKTGKDMSVKDVEDVFVLEFRDRKVGIKDWGEDTEASVIQRGRELVRAYMRDFAPRFEPQHAERQVSAWVGPVPVVGVIDAEGMLGLPGLARSKKYTIVDYKLVKRAKSENELENSLQLGFYGYVRRKETKTKEVQVGYCNLVKSKGTILWQPTEITDARIAWMRRIVLSVADAISAGVFPLTNPINWMCQPEYCDFYDGCRGSCSRK